MTRAFSLFELVLVVLLIGMVYALVVFPSAFTTQKTQQPTAIRWFTADEDMLVVYDKCSKIARFRQGELLSTNEPFSLAKSLAVYRPGDAYVLEPVTFDDMILQEKREDVCLRLRQYPNGTMDSLVVQLDGRFIVLGPFEGDAQEVNTLKDASTLLDQSPLLPTEPERYHHE